MSASREALDVRADRNPLVQASLLGEAVDAADLAILISDEDGRCIAANQQACTLLGDERDDLLALTVSDFVPDTDRQALLLFRAAYGAGGGSGVVDAVRSDGPPSVRDLSVPTNVARMWLLLSVGRAEIHLLRDRRAIG